jgi:hypothetical protein
LLERPRVRYQEIGDRRLVQVVPDEFLFIDQLETVNPSDGGGKVLNRTADLEYQKPFGRERCRVAAKLEAGRIVGQNLCQALQFGAELLTLLVAAECFRLWGGGASPRATISVRPWY